MLPFQGAGGMTALTAQAFLDRVMRITAKGPRRRKAPEKVNSPTKEQTTKIPGNPAWVPAAAPTKDGPRPKAGRTATVKEKTKERTKAPGKEKTGERNSPKPKAIGKTETMIPEPIGRRTTTKMIMIAGALAGAQEPIPEPIIPRFSVHPQDTNSSPRTKAKVEENYSQYSFVRNAHVP